MVTTPQDSPLTPAITPLEEDALKEFFNLGLGRAADSLSQMIHTEVLLSLPQLVVVERDRAMALVEESDPGKMVAIRQKFRGGMSGTALLIFPGAESLELVRSLLGDDIPLESLTELEQETLLDVGNAILNSFLLSFTEMMQIDFEFEPAEFLKSDRQALFDFKAHRASPWQPDQEENSGNEQAFFLLMDFKTGDEVKRNSTLRGYVVLLFSARDMAILKKELEKILSGY